MLTSSPLPSFLLSEGTHLKNENKVIVPVLFLKSLQMLSVDRRLIVRRVAVRAGGRDSQVQVQQQQLQQHFSHSITENTLLCYTQLVSSTHTLLRCSLTQDAHLHGTDWHTGEEGLRFLMDCLECMVWQSMGWGLCTVHLKGERVKNDNIQENIDMKMSVYEMFTESSEKAE